MPLTAEQRRERARKAINTRWHPDTDLTEIERQRRNRLIEALAAEAPAMTAEQSNWVRDIFRYLPDAEQ